jgi:hypothetical protein
MVSIRVSGIAINVNREKKFLSEESSPNVSKFVTKLPEQPVNGQ